MINAKLWYFLWKSFKFIRTADTFILHSINMAMMGTRGFARRLQRAAGWCKAAGRSVYCITPEPRTETIVGCDGSARYRAYERRFLPEQEWYRRGLRAFVSYSKRQGRFFS